jgi:hypothetical protein
VLTLVDVAEAALAVLTLVDGLDAVAEAAWAVLTLVDVAEAALAVLTLVDGLDAVTVMTPADGLSAVTEAAMAALTPADGLDATAGGAFFSLTTVAEAALAVLTLVDGLGEIKGGFLAAEDELGPDGALVKMSSGHLGCIKSNSPKPLMNSSCTSR